MQVLPRNRLEWLKLVLFPFKAFVIIAPVLFFVSANLYPPHSRFGPTYAEEYFVNFLGYDALILLFAALILGSIGPKGLALPTAGFGLAAAIIVSLLLPALAVAK